MRYTVWQRGLATSHTAPFFSTATVFHILLSTVVIIAPLLVAYRSQGFWMRSASYQEQAEVHFRHEALMLVELSNGAQLGWSTVPGLTALLGEGVRVPVIRSREEDENRDGLADSLSISFNLPLRPEEEVVSAHILLTFDVRLQRFSSVHMTGMLLFDGSGFPGASLHIVGDAGMVQRSPLKHNGRDSRYKDSPLPDSLELPEELRLSSLLSSYSARNLSLRLENEYKVWSPGRGSPQFIFSANVRYPVHTLQYTPGLWQVLKWGWVQYVSFLLISLYAAARAKDFVFGHQVLPTQATPPWKQ